jgi:hypothetical protein
MVLEIMYFPQASAAPAFEETIILPLEMKNCLSKARKNCSGILAYPQISTETD